MGNPTTGQNNNAPIGTVLVVGGGIAGLLIDLRDIPLRLPERRDRRRAALAGWSALAWPGDER